MKPAGRHHACAELPLVSPMAGAEPIGSASYGVIGMLNGGVLPPGRTPIVTGALGAAL